MCEKNEDKWMDEYLINAGQETEYFAIFMDVGKCRYREIRCESRKVKLKADRI